MTTYFKYSYYNCRPGPAIDMVNLPASPKRFNLFYKPGQSKKNPVMFAHLEYEEAHRLWLDHLNGESLESIAASEDVPVDDLKAALARRGFRKK